MAVVSRDGSSITCTLTNTTAASSGPINPVEVVCTTPEGRGSSDNAVVAVTGPSAE